MKILLVSPQSKVWSSPRLLHIGLGYIAASLEEAGHTVRVYDALVEDDSLESVLDEGFDVVGVTATTPLVKEAWAAAALAKERGALTVLGGPHPTIMPDESAAHPAVDFVVRGEGEDAMVELVGALEAMRARSSVASVPSQNRLGYGTGAYPPLGSNELSSMMESIAGLVYRTSDGSLVRAKDRQLKKELDELPKPAYHLFKVERYSNLQPLTDGIKPNARAYTILTSRGCPYGCTYCSRSVSGRTWRARKTEAVLAEWRWLVEDLKATEIGISDDVFNLRIDRAKEICRALIDEGLNKVPWVTIHGIRADHTDLELLQLMKKAGCRRVGFGVESGDPHVLELMKKQQTVDEVREAFRNAKRAGLQTMGFFMFGLQGENEAAMEATIRLALELDPDVANFMITSPFPGTELYDTVLREGKLFSHNWEDFAIHDEKAHFEIGAVTAELVERKWHEAYRRFYLRPSRLMRKAAQVDTWRHLPTYFAAAQRFFLNKAGKSHA